MRSGGKSIFEEAQDLMRLNHISFTIKQFKDYVRKYNTRPQMQMPCNSPKHGRRKKMVGRRID